MFTEEEYVEAIRLLFETVCDFMPNIGNCALQDYGQLNTGLIQGRKILTAHGIEIKEA